MNLLRAAKEFFSIVFLTFSSLRRYARFSLRIVLVFSFVPALTVALQAQPSTASAPIIPSAWSQESYSKYDTDSFGKFAPVDREVEPDRPDLDLLSAAIFFEINRVRKEGGISTLHYSAAMETAADLHSEDMVRFGFFSHTDSFLPDRATPDLRLAGQGIRNGEHAELIATAVGIRMKEGEKIRRSRRKGKVFLGASTDRIIPPHSYRSLGASIVAGWLSSPVDRENLMGDRFRFGGCGTAHFVDVELFDLDRFKATCLFSTHEK